MATTAQNPVSVLETNRMPQSIVVTSNLTINEGDLVYWDSTNFTATALSSNGQVAANFLGVALGSNNPQVYGNDPALVAIPVLVRGCIYVNSTAAETYNHFDDVTVGADAQTVVKSGATSGNRVGFVIIDPPAAPRPFQATPAPETVVGAAGVRLRIQLEPKHKVALAV
jgi:hypothetical protein